MTEATGSPGCTKRWGWALALAALLALASSLAAQEPPRDAVDQPIRVGVYENSPKLGLDERGRPQGIFIDLIEAIAEREGWSLEYVPGTWQEGLDRLSAGTIDLMPDVARTAERAGRFAFHEEAALSSWNQVYARPGSGIRSILDLDNRSVAVLEGSIQESQLDNMVTGFGIDIDLVSFPDFDSAFEAVRDGIAFAVITNRFFGEFNASTYGLEDTQVIFAPMRLYFAAPPNGRAQLLDAIDRHLERFKAAPQSPLYRSLDRWTGESPAAWPGWLPWAVGTLLVLLGSTAAIALVLRSQVRARTHQVYEQARQHTRQLEQRVEDRTRELQENSTFFQSLIDHIPSLIYYKNTALQFTGCNKAYERAFGVDRTELVGRHVTELSYLPLYQRESFEAEQRQLLHSGGHINRDVRLTFADGTEHDMLYSAARIQNDDQEPLGIVGICVDITVQKSVEAQLSRARDQAEAADRVKSAFLATMSHELRTPLNSILGFTGILLQELAGPLNEEQTRQLKMVSNSSKHLLNLINDVLDISRIEAGEMTLANEPFRITESAENVMGLLRPLAEEKTLNLRLNMQGGSRERRGDQRRFEQILLNLVGNAIKFTESGHVTLTIDTRSDEAHNGVTVEVEDTGIGIREADIESLFRPFRQVDSTLSRKHEGTGLGLVICKRLVDLMGGHIDVASRWGAGTRFTVELPLELATQGKVA